MNSLLMVYLILASSLPGAPPAMPQPGDKVLFLGDSNTYAGHFVADIDYYLLTRFPLKNIEVINLGLPSETISGQSERDHPFPRPNVHERLDRALKTIQPAHVIACYGMNDGIYSPFDEGRFAKYQEGFLTLVKKSRAAGARVTLLTTPPFDPKPVKAKLRPAGAPEYSYKDPFEDYDAVLKKYSTWLVSLTSTDLPVADAHSALLDQLKAKRLTKPEFIFSGDGIHPNASGHWFVAQEVLKAWNAPMPQGKVVAKPKSFPAIIDLTGVYPYVANPAWEDWVKERFLAHRGLHQLRIVGLEQGSYRLSHQSTELGKYTAEELAKGVDLLQFSDLPLAARAQLIRKLSTERTRELGQALLSDIGHKRPMTAAGKTNGGGQENLRRENCAHP